MSLNKYLERIKGKPMPTVSRSDYLRSVAFTGYRPEKLPFGYDFESEAAKKLKRSLYFEYEKLFRRDFKFFLTGGAMGSDLMAADVILELKKEYKRYSGGALCLLCLPCHEHCRNWCKEELEHLEKLLSDDVVAFYVSDKPYYNGCMQVRNQYMVDTSAVLLSVYDGKPGGTRNTLEYAQRLKRKIITINPEEGKRVELFIKKEDVSPRLNFLNSEFTD